MEKIRIYELARDLNMENRILLERIGEMDISVKSHMSSLDEETVDRIKAELLGARPQEIVVTRIKPTVIRKRKKVAKKETVHEEAISEQETDAEDALVTEEPTETARKIVQFLIKEGILKE